MSWLSPTSFCFIGCLYFLSVGPTFSPTCPLLLGCQQFLGGSVLPCSHPPGSSCSQHRRSRAWIVEMGPGMMPGAEVIVLEAWDRGLLTELVTETRMSLTDADDHSSKAVRQGCRPLWSGHLGVLRESHSWLLFSFSLKFES